MNEQVTEGGGKMIVTLRAYLARLQADELAKPSDRRSSVPSLTELAEAVGYSRQSMYNLVSEKNPARRLDLDTAAKIIDELRRRGFSMDITDLLAYRPADAEE